jgi:uncharacterized protein (TIGR03435 family)
MTPAIGRFLLLAFASLAAFGQTFEVASVKPATPDGSGLFRLSRAAGGPGTSDPEQLTYVGIPLKLVLWRAYEVEDYQLSGPGWLDNERYDIRAKIAPDVTKDQFRVMLQNLLIERFGMQIHRETREIQAYELVVAKGRLKMKESATASGESIAPGPNGTLATQKDKDGFTELPPGKKGMLRFMLVSGKHRVSARMQPISSIVSMCKGQVGHPVIDKTGLTGIYDFNLDFAPNAQLASAAEPSSAAPLDGIKEDGVPFLVAIQSLGLRFQPIKMPVEVIVIDHIEKIPTAN